MFPPLSCFVLLFEQIALKHRTIPRDEPATRVLGDLFCGAFYTFQPTASSLDSTKRR